MNIQLKEHIDRPHYSKVIHAPGMGVEDDALVDIFLDTLCGYLYTPDHVRYTLDPVTCQKCLREMGQKRG